MKQKSVIEERLKNCGRDKECIKQTLEKGLSYINNKSEQKRKLVSATNDFMQIVFVVLMIYLMFEQPFMTGLILFFGGLNNLFRKLVRKERKLANISKPQFDMIANMSRTKMGTIY